MIGFYLVMIATSSYIGPLPEAACRMAAAQLRSSGVVCRPADRLKMCSRDGGRSDEVCAEFDFPELRVAK